MSSNLIYGHSLLALRDNTLNDAKPGPGQAHPRQPCPIIASHETRERQTERMIVAGRLKLLDTMNKVI